MSAEFRGKNRKNLSKRAKWLIREDIRVARERDFPRFVGHSVSTQRKNIFVFFIDRRDMSGLSDYLCDMIYNVQLQARRLFTKMLHECRNKLFANSTVMLTSRTLRDIIYNVKLSAVAESHERRGVLWGLTISGFGNFLLIKT